LRKDANDNGIATFRPKESVDKKLQESTDGIKKGSQSLAKEKD
jgi:hypothetical protein